VSELVHHWVQAGPTNRLSPFFLEKGHTKSVLLRPEWLDQNNPDCIAVAAMAPQNVTFQLLFELDDAAGAHTAQSMPWPVPSAAGIAEIVRCGPQKASLEHLAVQMRSRRGVIEMVITRSPQAPTPASALLRGRTIGPTLVAADLGKRPPLPPLKERVPALVEAYQRQGATVVERGNATSDSDGRGAIIVQLLAGCHRLAVLGATHAPAPPDIDAGLFTLIDRQELDRDDEQSGQGSLSYCATRPMRTRLEFSGAPANSEITILHGSWPLSPHLPVSWGPNVRSRLAKALFEARSPPAVAAPSFATLGVRGTTARSIEVDPDSCYLVAAAPLRASAERISLAAQSGPVVRVAQSARESDGASVAICALGSASLDIEVQALGFKAAWVLGLWPTGIGPEGEQWDAAQ
jgi:hypothetical protein